MAVFTTAAPAGAAPHSHGCKVVSTSSVEQTRNVTGVITGVTYVNGHAVYTYGQGIQHRVATTTVTKCKGRTTSAMTYTAWS